MKLLWSLIGWTSLLCLCPCLDECDKIFAQDFDRTAIAMNRIMNDAAVEAETLGSKRPGFNIKDLMRKRISMNFENANLRTVLRRINELTGIPFVYENQIVERDGITFSCKNETVEEVLSRFFDELKISYVVLDDNIVLSQQKDIEPQTGSISGTVKDKEGEPVISATVIIEENKFGCSTNIDGEFKFGNLKSGTYTLKISCVGYRTQIRRVNLEGGQNVILKIVMPSEIIQIGGIEVVSNQELLQNDTQTKTVINSGEIEHFQATNIGDVLNLVPGIQKTTNPGLGKMGQISIRGDVRGDDISKSSAFGTLIVVDGVPQSNNSNMQLDAPAGGTIGSYNVNGGFDLRKIPADNLQSIEVVTGLPSVKYGDMTAGVINIKTKTSESPQRLKVKNNPATNEANLGGGFKLQNEDVISYNVNYARAERDLRIVGDEYSRTTGQLVYSTKFMNNQLGSNFKLSGQFIRDEEQPQNDYSNTNNYNRGYKVEFTTWGEYVTEMSTSSFEYNVYASMNKIDSRKSHLVQAPLRVLPNGDTVTAYVGEILNKGVEWAAGGRVEYNNVFYTGNYIHKFLTGTEMQYNANTGQGRIIDSVFNYYGVDSPARSRSFDDIPGQLLWSLYAEDKITGKLLLDFSLLCGFRYEMYRPFGINLKGLWGNGDFVKSHQGSWFNPRVALMIYLSNTNQLRLSFGTTTKSPSMATLYPNPAVLTWRNPDTKTDYSFKFDLDNPNLRASREVQYEVSFDQELFRTIGLSVSAYYKERKNDPGGNDTPLFVESKVGNETKIYYVGQYESNNTLRKQISKGIEFTLRTRQIKPLNMSFQVTGAYSYIDRPSCIKAFDSSPDNSLGQYANYKVPGVSIDTLIGMIYSGSGSWRDRIQLNYFVKYTNAALGLWITLSAEQLLNYRYQDYNREPVDFNVASSSAVASELFYREIKKQPMKWLLNLNVSKSLWKGAEVSFYVNNFLDDPAVYQYYNDPTTLTESTRNPDLFYGIEFSFIIDELIK